MIQGLIGALAILLLVVITAVILGIMLAVQEGLLRLKEMRQHRKDEARYVAENARLAGLVTEARRVVKLLQEPAKVDTPEVGEAKSGLASAIEDALRESGYQFPEEYK